MSVSEPEPACPIVSYMRSRLQGRRIRRIDSQETIVGSVEDTAMDSMDESMDVVSSPDTICYLCDEAVASDSAPPLAVVPGPALGGVPVAGPTPKPPELTMKQKAKNSAKPLGIWTWQQIVCPHPSGGTMDIWVPEYGCWGQEVRADVSKIATSFMEGRHHQEDFHWFLVLYESTLCVFEFAEVEVEVVVTL
eukprot:s300_g18.t1